VGSGRATSGETTSPNSPGGNQEETDSTAVSPVAAAAEELYGADPEAFTGRRGELAAAARDAGDKAAAKAITALRKPTRAAWVVNQLARTDPGAPGRLAELAAGLRAAQEARDGQRLRELSAARGSLVDALTAQALAVAGVTDPAASLRLEVAETLTAAIADPEVAADFAAGTLTRAVQWSGFGLPPATPTPHERTGPDEGTGRTPRAGVESGAGSVDGVTTRAGRAAAPSRAGARSRAGTVPAGRASASAGTVAGAGQVVRADPAAAAREAARRQAELDERLAREAADQAARRREQYEEAERQVTAAAAATAAAVGAEDRLEAEVRDLEQRLTQARADLAAARMRARRAEAGERRARQARDRLFGG
jgi:hypothetical protein